MERGENHYSQQISSMGNPEKSGKIILSNKKEGQINSLGHILLWFFVFIIITIGVEYTAVYANLPKGMMTFMLYCFFFFVIVDLVFFITLVFLIINAAKSRGFE